MSQKVLYVWIIQLLTWKAQQDDTDIPLFLGRVHIKIMYLTEFSSSFYGEF